MNVYRVAGLSAPVVLLFSVLAAVSLWPEFSWTDNHLSDLAGFEGMQPYWSARGLPSVIFNAGLVLVGVLELVFSGGLAKSGLVSKEGSYLFAFSAVSLVGVGALPETLGWPHVVASYAFFISMPLAVLLAGVSIKEEKLGLAFKACAVLLGLGVIALGALDLGAVMQFPLAVLFYACTMVLALRL